MFNRLYNWTVSCGRQRRVALALLLGALSALALPPWYFFPLVVPAFAGLLWLLDGAEQRARPLRAAAITSWLFGVGHFSVGLHWIVEPFLVDAARHGWLAPFALVGMAGGMALFPAATGLMTVAVARRFGLDGLARAVTFAVVWVFWEWVRSWLFTGFPWSLIGYVWAQTPEISQAAAVVGIFGLSLITVVAASVPAVLGAGGGKRRGWTAVAVWTVALPAVIWAAGAGRLASAPGYEAGDDAAMVPGVRLRIVQANIAQKDKWRRELRAGNLQRHVALSRQPAGQTPTHVIWPETAVPFFLAGNRPEDDVVRKVVATAAPPGGVVITGAPRRSGDVNHLRFWNAAHAIDGDGRIVASYDKSHLVPFGEYVPLRGILPLDKLVPGQGDFSAGAGPQTLSVPGLPPVSPLICYEAIFPTAVTSPTARPGWLLSLTNDAWFGTFAGPQQHFAIAKMRTIEEGLPMVRAANTGISAVVDPYGRTLASLGIGVEGIIDTGLPRALTVLTPYARWGNAVPAASSLALVLLIAGRRILHKRGGGGPAESP